MPDPDPLELLPERPASPPLAVRVTPAAERAVRDGHPWVFENSIRDRSRDGIPGDVAVLFDRKNRFLAVGLYDPESPIRVRILSAGSPAPIGREWFRARIDEAMALRRPLLDDPTTTGIRLISGEGDGLPGFVVDCYGGALVMKSYTTAWHPWLRHLVPPLMDATGAASLLYLPSRRVAASEHTPDPLRAPAPLIGRAPPNGLAFEENGLRFEAHPVRGHKTGFYLDQRENRARMRSLARGCRVLNAFSYTGGFSVAAAAGGAVEVLSVDTSEPALRQAERHFELNSPIAETAAAVHRIRAGDAFRIMEELSTAGEAFDLVVVDPPSFAKERGQEAAALNAYASLTRLALGVLRPGGLLVQASCTARIDPDSFFGAVHHTARSVGRPLDELARTGHPADHPVRHPEGRYLKCLFARVPT